MSITDADSTDLKLLDDSATFAMSLGAKELFHTNFLGFLLESRQPELADTQRALRHALGFPVKDGEETYCAVWREEAHLDIVLVPIVQAAGALKLSEGRALVIEAKMKSLPDSAQLVAYDRKLDGGITLNYEDFSSHKSIQLRGLPKPRKGIVPVVPEKVLLTPGGETINGWTGVSWSAVASALPAKVALADGPSPLITIIQDYKTALETLLRILERARGRFQDRWENRAASTFIDLHRDISDPEFTRRRLHDFIAKAVYHSWVRAQKAELQKRGVNELAEYVYFSNNLPCIGFGVALKGADGREVLVGVQVQGTEFRRYLGLAKAMAGLEDKVADAWSILQSWFVAEPGDPELHGKGGIAEVRTTDGGRRTNLKVFDQDKFLYSATDVGHLTLGQLDHLFYTALLKATAVGKQLAAHPAWTSMFATAVAEPLQEPATTLDSPRHRGRRSKADRMRAQAAARQSVAAELEQSEQGLIQADLYRRLGGTVEWSDVGTVLTALVSDGLVHKDGQRRYFWTGP